MKRVLLTGLLLVCLPATALGQATLSDLRDTLALTMERWQEHREQTIEVREIKSLEGGEDASESKEALNLRYKTLTTKRWSNREWRDYWQGEANLASEVLNLYEQLMPEGGDGPLAEDLARLEQAHTDASALLASHEAFIAERTEALAATKLTLQGHIAAERESLPLREAQAAELRAALDAATIEHARQQRALELLTADTTPEARAAAESALATAKAALDKADLEMKAATEGLATITKDIAYVEKVLAGEEPEGQRPENAVLASALEELAQIPGELTTAASELETKKAALQNATAVLNAAKDDLQRIPQRVDVLKEWIALANDKQVNQDVYYEAINADLAAVKERMRDFDVERSVEHIGLSRRICEEGKARDESPLDHYYRCAAQIDVEKLELEDLLKSNQASLRLAAVQAASLEQLIDAQRTDEALVGREVEIPKRELARIRKANHEDEQWSAVWKAYEERALTKTKKLSAAVISSKVTMRAVKVNIAFYETETSNIQSKIEDIEAYQAEREKSTYYYKALVATAWQYLRQAWLVPIYLLLAWLLLWLAKRTVNKVLSSARQEVDDRDALQRVETLGAVARGAFKLVIFIAAPLLVLDALSVDIGPILGGAAIFGLAISFGSQSLVKDIVTGFFVLLENQYAVGDVVEIGGQGGTVERISLRRTVLRDLQGRVHQIANGSVNKVINSSQGWSQVLIHLGVGYESDLDLVKETVNRVGDELFGDEAWQGKLSDPPRYIGLVEFGDSSLNVRVMFKTPIFENWGAEREFNYRIKKAFDEVGINIPFPQRDLHIIRQAEDAALETPDAG